MYETAFARVANGKEAGMRETYLGLGRIETDLLGLGRWLTA